MKNLIFLIAMAELLFGFEGLAAPLIPHGFTTDKSKSFPLVISIPIETQQQIQFKPWGFNSSLIQTFCENLKTNTITRTTKIEEEHYTLVPYSGSISRHNNKQYKVFCLFGWIKTKYYGSKYAWGDKYIAKRFGSYYRIKSRRTSRPINFMWIHPTHDTR